MSLMIIQNAAESIRKRLGDFTPAIGIILGSGLGKVAEALQNKITIPYEDIPGFPIIHVKGHQSRLSAGYMGNTGIICLEGRAHSYEEQLPYVVTLVRTLKLLGIHTLLLTNASGSLRKEVGPGNIVMIHDHINFQPFNPLVGMNDETFGPRFLPMHDAYDENIRQIFIKQGQSLGLHLYDGVYLSVIGPVYETPAEIRAFRTLGADLVGMSTVPEVIVARHCGLKVGALAVITNYATGITDEPHDHDKVVAVANRASHHLVTLLITTIKNGLLN